MLVPQGGFRSFCEGLIARYPINNPLTGGWAGKETRQGLIYREQMQRRKFLICVLNGDFQRARRCVPRIKALLQEQLDEIMFANNETRSPHSCYNNETKQLHVGNDAVTLLVAQKLKEIDEWCDALLFTGQTGVACVGDNGKQIWPGFEL